MIMDSGIVLMIWLWTWHWGGS